MIFIHIKKKISKFKIMFNTIFPKIHKEGYKFLAISIIATFITLLFTKVLGLLLILITIWVYYFFRDPERYSINDDVFLVSPADGLITDVSEQTGPIELQLENTTFTRVSIFMNVFNCHVNRTPITGKVEEIYYKPGKFLNASLDKASEENERNYYRIKSSKTNEEIIIVQIAGLIARRIVCEVEQGQNLKQGERIGMIRFGSRVDVFFKDKKVLAKLGQNVVAGESLIASE
jgi:phosphatidylserine decarboxylase